MFTAAALALALSVSHQTKNHTTEPLASPAGDDKELISYAYDVELDPRSVASTTTSTTTTTTTVPPEPAPPAAKKKPAASGSTGPLDGDRFDRLAMCESGGDPTAVSPTGKYRGAFQFSLSTWQSAGMSGDPINYSYGTQKATAMSWATQADPYGQWPVCWARSA